MYPFRDKTPKHRKGRKPCKHYKSYKKTLRADFLKRCGYCNDSDLNSKRIFVIDHFVPQTPDGFTHPIASNYYYNLIYSCSFCNGKKSNKWPTNNHKKPNDGIKGFIMPIKKKYAELFERDINGYIVIKNKSLVGKYIFDELNLGWVLHSLNWKFEKLLAQEEELEAIYNKTKDPVVKNDINSLRNLRLSVVDDINKLIND